MKKFLMAGGLTAALVLSACGEEDTADELDETDVEERGTDEGTEGEDGAAEIGVDEEEAPDEGADEASE